MGYDRIKNSCLHKILEVGAPTSQSSQFGTPTFLRRFHKSAHLLKINTHTSRRSTGWRRNTGTPAPQRSCIYLKFGAPRINSTDRRAKIFQIDVSLSQGGYLTAAPAPNAGPMFLIAILSKSRRRSGSSGQHPYQQNPPSLTKSHSWLSINSFGSCHDAHRMAGLTFHRMAHLYISKSRDLRLIILTICKLIPQFCCWHTNMSLMGTTCCPTCASTCPKWEC